MPDSDRCVGQLFPRLGSVLWPALARAMLSLGERNLRGSGWAFVSAVAAGHARDAAAAGSVLWRLRGIAAPVPAILFEGPLFADKPMGSRDGQDPGVRSYPAKGKMATVLLSHGVSMSATPDLAVNAAVRGHGPQIADRSGVETSRMAPSGPSMSIILPSSGSFDKPVQSGPGDIIQPVPATLSRRTCDSAPSDDPTILLLSAEESPFSPRKQAAPPRSPSTIPFKAIGSEMDVAQRCTYSVPHRQQTADSRQQTVDAVPQAILERSCTMPLRTYTAKLQKKWTNAGDYLRPRHASSSDHFQAGGGSGTPHSAPSIERHGGKGWMRGWAPEGGEEGKGGERREEQNLLVHSPMDWSLMAGMVMPDDRRDDQVGGTVIERDLAIWVLGMAVHRPVVRGRGRRGISGLRVMPRR
ncbi:uncharacterized protein N7482_002623 [Penicillium canariense]|uniref:Uncharacterized protein n=1 Tax=Penicillium canariense TaxID=189055 RepID=A0A9W9IJB8_9EURO|nr:uncharacterized protein N7482_002623 [Penicillium canariense]KAJ5176746.1 hypothetical protein N7482_002623 [Penicillium canariense]